MGFGAISDDRKLALIYSAADVFCAPSVEENLATTAIEALACGTPVLAFNIGGFSDIVEHTQCGYLATPVDPASLAMGLNYFFRKRLMHEDARPRCRCPENGPRSISIHERMPADTWNSYDQAFRIQ